MAASVNNLESPQTIKRKKPTRKCAAAYCEAQLHLYSWPKDRSSSDALTSFIRQKEKGFQLTGSNKRICCKHFKEEAFSNLYAYAIGAENV